MPDDPIEIEERPETTQEAAPKYVFFVYIVESPSAPDLYRGRSEGALVPNALGLDQIPCLSRTAINREAFEAALQIGLPEAMKQFAGRYPMLHLSAHGASEGIQLSSGETISWPELRELLVPINESLGGDLLLCMSACEGYSACLPDGNATPRQREAPVLRDDRQCWSANVVRHRSLLPCVLPSPC